MRTAERQSPSLTMRPEQVALGIFFNDPARKFEDRCLVPGTRCCKIMTAIINGEPPKDIAKRYGDKVNTIRVYALVLRRQGYKVDVPPLDPEENIPPAIPQRLLNMPRDLIETVRKMREQGIWWRAIIETLKITKATYDDIVYYTLHDHWRMR